MRTYIMLKPDAVKRRLIGDVVTRIEKKGYTITGMKMFNMDREILKEHYAHIVNRPFYPEIEEYMTSGPVVGMIVEGEDVVFGMRALMGPTSEAPAGTIRGDYAMNGSENVIHGSDSITNAEIEIARFFGEDA